MAKPQKPTPQDAPVAEPAIVWRHVDELAGYPKNSRTHTPEQIGQIAASMRRFGFTNAILVRAGTIIAGHARLEAAKQVWAAGEAIKNCPRPHYCPTVALDHLSEDEARALVIADNQLALTAGWDPEILRLELAALDDAKFDLGVLGFSETELVTFMAGSGRGGLTDPDDVPEPPTHPVTVPGDVWILGAHRLMCGSSTDAGNVETLMAGHRALLVATDPPYLIDYVGGAHPGRADEKPWANHADHGPRAKQARASRDKDWSGKYIEVEKSDAASFFGEFIANGVAIAAEPSAPWYIWHADRRTVELVTAMRASGLLVHQTIIWVKSRPVLTYSHFMQAHEPCLYGWLEGHAPEKDRRPPVSERTVWEIPVAIEDGAARIHPTMKPVEIVSRPIEYHTRPGELIFEPFSGSGTALIAATKLGRVCYAMELSPPFVDVAIQRWQNFSGEKATLESDGRTFDAIAAARVTPAAALEEVSA